MPRTALRACPDQQAFDEQEPFVQVQHAYGRVGNGKPAFDGDLERVLIGLLHEARGYVPRHCPTPRSSSPFGPNLVLRRGPATRLWTGTFSLSQQSGAQEVPLPIQ